MLEKQSKKKSIATSGRGGARSGSGRKPGSKNRTTRILEDYAQKIAAGEAVETPLDLMLGTMHYLVERAKAIEAENPETHMRIVVEKTEANDKPRARIESSLEYRMAAVDVAAKAAPYVHPRLAQVEANVRGRFGLYELGLLELDQDLANTEQ